MKQCKQLKTIDLSKYDIKEVKTDYNQTRCFYNNMLTTYGRILEDILRIEYNNKSDLKENKSHLIAEDIIINRKKCNMKAINCEMKSIDADLENMINYYIEIDFCKYLLFSLRIDNQVYSFIMKWSFAKQFILKFGVKEHSKIRIKDNSNKTRQQLMLKWIKENM